MRFQLQPHIQTNRNGGIYADAILRVRLEASRRDLEPVPPPLQQKFESALVVGLRRIRIAGEKVLDDYRGACDHRSARIGDCPRNRWRIAGKSTDRSDGQQCHG